MNIIFAGIPWRSSISDATDLLQAKGFTVSQKDNNSLIARGTIFGKVSGVLLEFDVLGLYTVGVRVGTQVKNVGEDYNLIKGLLVEKYGLPSDNMGVDAEAGWLTWESAETAGNGKVDIVIDDDKTAIYINYKSPEARQALEDEIVTEMRNINESRDAALDLL